MSTWRDTRLGDEIELAYGKAMPAHARVPGDFKVFGSNGVVGTHVEALIDGPGIIVGRKGTVGAVTYSAKPFWPIDTTYYVVNKGGHDWRYLNYLLLSVGLTGLNSHSAVPGLNREDAYSISVRMPPLEEQQEIAGVLDAIGRGIEIESEALSLALDLKEATMRAVFASGLHAEPTKATELGEVPEGWNVVAFSTLRESLRYGTSNRCTTTPATYPVLRIPNILSAHIAADDLKFCDMPDEEADRYALEDGDLIFIRTNGVIERLGLCAVYRGIPEGALFASYLIRARLTDGIDPDYVAYFFGSPVGIQMIASRATPAADGKFNLNTGIIDSLLVPLPPSEEQGEISGLLREIDTNISLHRRRRQALEQLLTALAGELLAGVLRVGDLNVAALGMRRAEIRAAVA